MALEACHRHYSIPPRISYSSAARTSNWWNKNTTLLEKTSKIALNLELADASIYYLHWGWYNPSWRLHQRMGNQTHPQFHCTRSTSLAFWNLPPIRISPEMAMYALEFNSPHLVFHGESASEETHYGLYYGYGDYGTFNFVVDFSHVIGWCFCRGVAVRRTPDMFTEWCGVELECTTKWHVSMQ